MKNFFDIARNKIKVFFTKQTLKEIKEKNNSFEIDDLSANSTEEKNSILKQLKEETLLGGGLKRQEAQHKKGKYLARERIEKILDENSFNEIDRYVTHNCSDFGMENNKLLGDGVVGGHGTINGRLVYIYAQDFTVLGGSLGQMQSKKICKIMDNAVKTGAPIISLNDSGGARIQEGVNSLAGYAEIFYRNSIYSGVIPQISLILGPCAGGAVYSPATQDFIFMTETNSYMFITGPQVIKAVTHEDVSFSELGGAEIHTTQSGVAHFKTSTEDEAFDKLKRLISYLPDNNLDDPPYITNYSVNTKGLEELNTIIPDAPNKAYNMYNVINAIADNNSFFEVSENWAKNIIIGYIRIEGMVLAVVANNPNVLAGALDINASVKAARFIRFCDAFNIPILTLQDVPGFLPGVAQEHNGIIRNGAKLLFAYAEATVPKFTVILRKSYGGAYCVMNSKHLNADLNVAWPSAEIAVMGPEGAVNIISRKEIAEADNPEEKRKELISQYKDKFANPYISAQNGFIDDVIEPKNTRQIISGALKVFTRKRTKLPSKKHGNMPL